MPPKKEGGQSSFVTNYSDKYFMPSYAVLISSLIRLIEVSISSIDYIF